MTSKPVCPRAIVAQFAALKREYQLKAKGQRGAARAQIEAEYAAAFNALVDATGWAKASGESVTYYIPTPKLPVEYAQWVKYISGC